MKPSFFTSLLLTGWCLGGMTTLPLHADETEAFREEQTKAASHLWKNVITQGLDPNVHATTNFLLVGTVDARVLESMGKVAEKVLPTLRTNLDFGENETIWEGRLVIHAAKLRPHFQMLFSKVKKSRPGNDEISTFVHQGRQSFILLGPPLTGNRKVSHEHDLITQLAGVMLTHRREINLIPDWLIQGYGRSELYRYSPRSFTQERVAAAQLLSQSKYNIHELMAGNLGPMETQILGASLADFLAHSPQMSKYWPLMLAALGLDGQSLDDAIKNAKLDRDFVQKAWVAWSKNQK